MSESNQNISLETLEKRKQIVLNFLQEIGCTLINNSGISHTAHSDDKVHRSVVITGCGSDCGHYAVFLSDKMEFNQWWWDDFNEGMDALREYSQFKRKYKLM